MIRYYTYYNFGGYKDLYLGSSQDSFEFTYFLPLLPIWAESDREVYRQRAEAYAELPKIYDFDDKSIQLPVGSEYPQNANEVLSHSGFKVFFKSLGEDLFALAFSGISSPNLQDDQGRSCPFLFMMTGGKEDRPKMYSFANYILNSMADVESFLLQCISFDQEHNGLKCNLKALNLKVEEIYQKNQNSELTLNGSVYKFEVQDNVHPLIAVSSGLDLDFAKDKQNIKGQKIAVVLKMGAGYSYSVEQCDLTPIDENGELLKLRSENKRLLEQLSDSKKKVEDLEKTVINQDDKIKYLENLYRKICIGLCLVMLVCLVGWCSSSTHSSDKGIEKQEQVQTK